ncbi:hypothetical protein FA13DRAFT_1801491 [Coprinellus micaceus]|uniref:Uncharacterized protein n=1 Tax=Coprinellus micaceus TaxID=71717 RepID=A0A4Y7SDX6_COPMI|nr:hypothetical protein FA13DRAFT_1801491 [Coprinellus micaceus]
MAAPSFNQPVTSEHLTSLWTQMCQVNNSSRLSRAQIGRKLAKPCSMAADKNLGMIGLASYWLYAVREAMEEFIPTPSQLLEVFHVFHRKTPLEKAFYIPPPNARERNADVNNRLEWPGSPKSSKTFVTRSPPGVLERKGGVTEPLGALTQRPATRVSTILVKKAN